MARRRKKKNVTSKTALKFVESPTRGSPNLPSPVYCSDNPPTASVVPIDEGINFSWVSPQFRYPLSTRKRRRRPRAHGGSSHNPQGGELSGKENASTKPPCHGGKTTKTFPTLKFVGTEHSPTANCDTSGNAVDVVCGTRMDALHTPVCRRVTRSRSIGLNINSDRTILDVGNCNILSTQVHAASLLHARCLAPSGVSLESGCDVDKNKCTIRFTTSDGHLDTCDSPMNETQQRPKPRGTRQSTRRLFSIKTARQTLVNPAEHPTSLLRLLDIVADDYDTEPAYNYSVNTPKLNQSTSHSFVESGTPRTARRWRFLVETPQRDSSTSIQPTVLVADTPVEDYALPVRLRNLKYSRILRSASK